MNQVKLLITGYPSFDRILNVTRAPEVGQTGIILDPPGIPEPTPGGCACNIAVAAARLGVAAAPLIVLGDDADGLTMQARLAAEGVDTRCIQNVKDGKTAGTFLFIDPTGGHQTFYFPGSAANNVDLQIPAEILTGLRYAVITVGNPFHTWQFVERLAAGSVPMVWSLRNDPQAFPQDLAEKLARLCRVLVMNEYEAIQLVQMLNLPSITGLFDLGVEMMVVTHGKRGSRVYQGEHILEIPIVQPDAVVDPTGAGDAFIGGLLSGLCRGADLETAARIGATTSSFVIEQWGCQTSLPGWQQMENRYQTAFGAKPKFGGL